MEWVGARGCMSLGYVRPMEVALVYVLCQRSEQPSASLVLCVLGATAP